MADSLNPAASLPMLSSTPLGDTPSFIDSDDDMKDVPSAPLGAHMTGGPPASRHQAGFDRSERRAVFETLLFSARSEDQEEVPSENITSLLRALSKGPD
jgi:hypothetical protein